MDAAKILALALLILALVAAIDLGLFVAWAVRRDAVAAGRAKPLFAPAWSVVDVWVGGQVFVTLLMTIMLGVMVAIAVVMGLTGSSSLSDQDKLLRDVVLPALLPSMALQNGLFVAVPAVYITRKYRQSLASIGFRWRPTGKELRTGVVLGFLMLVFGLSFGAAAQAVAQLLVSPEVLKGWLDAGKSLGNEDFIKDAISSPVYRWMILIAAGALAPFGEEFFFRGFLFRAVRHRFGLAAGVVVSSIVFAAIHGAPLQVFLIIPIGIVLALAYHRTGSLWVVITMHAVFNSTQILYLIATQ